MTDLPHGWREARPPVKGLHLDSAACSRQSFAAIDAAAAHARREAEVGGYVAAQEADAVLTQGRTAVAALTAMTAEDVVFTTGACHALDLLLSAWPSEQHVIACAPGEFGSNFAIMAANGFEPRLLPVDGLGRVAVDDLTSDLAADPPTLVHLTVVPSHRGIVQPLSEIADVCRDQGVPLVVDAAQGLGHVDCAVPVDAIYGTSRKWLTGPRGVGVLAVSPERAAVLRPRLPPPGWMTDVSPLRCLELGEANAAARIGFSISASRYLDVGPERIRNRLAEVGALTRTVLSEVDGWWVVEPSDSPTAITTLAPPHGTDLVRLRQQLIEQHAIVTTVAETQRAPFELSTPVLRLSPHVDVTADDLTTFARALGSLCAR